MNVYRAIEAIRKIVRGTPDPYTQPYYVRICEWRSYMELRLGDALSTFMRRQSDSSHAVRSLAWEVDVEVVQALCYFDKLSMVERGRIVLILQRTFAFYTDGQKAAMNRLIDLLPGGSTLYLLGLTKQENMDLRINVLPSAPTVSIPVARVRQLYGNGSIHQRDVLALSLGAFAYKADGEAYVYYFRDDDTAVLAKLKYS